MAAPPTIEDLTYLRTQVDLPPHIHVQPTELMTPEEEELIELQLQKETEGMCPKHTANYRRAFDANMGEGRLARIKYACAMAMDCRDIKKPYGKGAGRL
jgi:hypothetical protein